MRLVDLHPRWVADHGAPEGAIQGVGFDCPCCVGTPRATRLAIFFSPPLTPGPPADVSPESFVRRNEADHLSDHHVGELLWARTGEDFETLTLAPSINCAKWGHWHGFVTNGDVT